MKILYKVTLKSLKKNKTRTMVTIIGIVLATALITAITTFTSSIQQCLYKNSLNAYGDWYGEVISTNTKTIDEIKNNSKINQIALKQNIGFSLLQNCKTKGKPYLYIVGIDDIYENTMPIELTSGRMPENPEEIIVPLKLLTSGGMTYKLMDTAAFEIGKRTYEGSALGLTDSLKMAQNAEMMESIDVNETRNYTIVGFYENIEYDYDYSIPGYVGITMADNRIDDSYTYNIYFKTTNIKDATIIVNQYKEKKMETIYNNAVLAFLGESDDEIANATMKSVMALILLVIMVGSVLLIYNSFAISIGERSRLIGMLSSVGASKNQLRGSIFFEALITSVIGIPIGIMIGVGSIWLVFLLLKDNMTMMISAIFKTAIPLTIHISLWAIIVTVITAVATVILSVLEPAEKALKMPAIQSIQQLNDIKIKKRKIRTPKWIYKIFGFEGMLALKNFKRNKRKYRITVISLFMSIVLFISASSVCMYAFKTMNNVFTVDDYDISYSDFSMNQDENKTNTKELFESFSKIDGVDRISMISSRQCELSAPKELFSDDYISSQTRMGVFEYGNVHLFRVDDVSFEKYLEDHNLSKSKYMNIENPVLIATATLRSKDPKTGIRSNFNIFKNETVAITAMSKQYNSQTRTSNSITTDLNIGLFTDELVLGMNSNNGNGVNVMIPESMIGSAFDSTIFYPNSTIYISAKNHVSVYDQIKIILKNNTISDEFLDDIAQEDDYNENMMLIIQILAYGFITMISLIAMANVFNTISTNVFLRRREFAMLKSVGMTERGFKKMMNIECLLYGAKALLTGLPVSFLITWYIYKSISVNIDIAFVLPWKSIGIAVFSVFAVVFATMIYATKKIRKDNPIDALKNENL